jgi:hypothetical protein
MIARIGRLAGAILAECDGSYFLIGNTKEPCDWEQKGFKAPAEVDAKKTPVLALEAVASDISLGPSHLVVHMSDEQSGEEMAGVYAERFLIVRNASVSDRLWNLVVGEDGNAEVEATWLLNMPDAVWQIVRDTVLKCT